MKQMFLALIRNRLTTQHAVVDSAAGVDQAALSGTVRELDRSELCQAVGGFQGETEVLASSPYRGW